MARRNYQNPKRNNPAVMQAKQEKKIKEQMQTVLDDGIRYGMYIMEIICLQTDDISLRTTLRNTILEKDPKITIKEAAELIRTTTGTNKLTNDELVEKDPSLGGYL